MNQTPLDKVDSTETSSIATSVTMQKTVLSEYVQHKGQPKQPQMSLGMNTPRQQSNCNTIDETCATEHGKVSNLPYKTEAVQPSDTQSTTADVLKSPATPSPPRNYNTANSLHNPDRRSSTSIGFLTSPLHNRVDAMSSPQSPGIAQSKVSSPSSARMLAPATPKSRNTEIFLSPSPHLKSPNVSKDHGEKPIRDLSNSLKTRLNYALVKLQNGWTDKSLDDLEFEFNQHPKQPHRNSHDTDHIEPSATANDSHTVRFKLDEPPKIVEMPNIKSQRSRKPLLQKNGRGLLPNVMFSPSSSYRYRNRRASSSYVNKFAEDQDGSEGWKSPQHATDGNGSLEQARDNTAAPNMIEKELESQEKTDNANTSAHLAFLKALSSPKASCEPASSPSPLRWINRSPPGQNRTKRPVMHINTQSPSGAPLYSVVEVDTPADAKASFQRATLRRNKTRPEGSPASDHGATNKDGGPVSEVEAIETLMALSSPHKSKATSLNENPWPSPARRQDSDPEMRPNASTSDLKYEMQQSDMETEADESP